MIIVKKKEEQPDFIGLNPRDVQEWTTKNQAFWFPKGTEDFNYHVAVGMAIEDAFETLGRGTKFILVAARKPYLRDDLLMGEEYGVVWYTDPWIQANMAEKKVGNDINSYVSMPYNAPSKLKGKNLRVLGCLRTP